MSIAATVKPIARTFDADGRLVGVGAIVDREQIAAFSFDVFDTSLLRRCTTPQGVFERAFALAPFPSGSRKLMEVFVQQRCFAEAKARKAAHVGKGSSEVTIDAIYECFPAHIFGLARADVSVLIEAEWRAERELCFANPEIIGLFHELRDKGVRVGFLSDTYWPTDRLTELLRICVPGLEWDFLYASCDHRSGKAEGLFRLYLKDQGLNAGSTGHIGDNETADYAIPRQLGVHAFRYPQAGPALAAVFQRETLMFDLMCAPTTEANRLDRGARTLRRAAAARVPARGQAFAYGVEVLGPVMVAFDRFVAARVAALRGDGRRVAVAFLGRDGLLPFEMWRASRDALAAYVEINRRVALVSAAMSAEAIAELFRPLQRMNLAMAVSFLKCETSRLRRYFKKQPDGIACGAAFADALPRLISRHEIATLAARMRRQMMAHLRQAIPEFDASTDLVLVDLGYSGTVQKSLRRILDLEGCPQRLHGFYLLTADEAFADILPPDTAEGLLSDAVLAPQAKRALLKNVSLLEQMCGDARGTVLDYDKDGSVQRERDPRPPNQIEMCRQIREGTLHFARASAALTEDAFPDGFAPCAVSAAWTGAILARALLLPTDDELSLLGGMKHDVNMGSQALAPLADWPATAALVSAKPLNNAFAIHSPPGPMWMAGSMAGLSPVHGLLYALCWTGYQSADTVGDAAVSPVEVALITTAGGHMATVTAYRNGLGELRLYIPLPVGAGVSAVAIPAAALPPRGVLRGVALQVGATASDAMVSPEVTILPRAGLQALDMTLEGDLIATRDNGHLVVPVPPFTDQVAVVTVTVAPLDGLRLLASSAAAPFDT